MTDTGEVMLQRLRDAGVVTDGTYGPFIDPEKVLTALAASPAPTIVDIAGIDAIRAAVVVEMENEGVVTWGDAGHRERFLALAAESRPDPLPYFTYTQGHGDPDRCSVHGDIPSNQSQVDHMRDAHGQTYEEYLAQEPPDAPDHIPGPSTVRWAESRPDPVAGTGTMSGPTTKTALMLRDRYFGGQTVFDDDLTGIEQEARRAAFDEAIAAVGRLPWNPVELPDGMEQEWAVGEYGSAVIDALTRLRDGASPDSPEVR